jgi:hypothetical protein
VAPHIALFAAATVVDQALICVPGVYRNGLRTRDPTIQHYKSALRLYVGPEDDLVYNADGKAGFRSQLFIARLFFARHTIKWKRAHAPICHITNSFIYALNKVRRRPTPWLDRTDNTAEVPDYR